MRGITVHMTQVSVVDLLPGRLTGFFQRIRLIESKERNCCEIVEQGVHGIIQIRASPFSIRLDRRDRIRGLRRPNELPCGQHQALLQFFDGGLGCGVEQANRFDQVSEKFHTDRVGVGGRKDIHDAATDAELPRNFHDGHSSVSQAKEVGDERVPFESCRCFEAKDRLLECRARKNTVHRGGDGSDKNSGRVDQQAMERRHPVGNQPDMRRRRFIGQRFPLWEPGEVLDWTTHEFMEEAQVIEHSFGGVVVRSYNNPWTGAVWNPLVGVVQQGQRAGRSRAMGSQQTDTSLFLAKCRTKRREPGWGGGVGFRHASLRG